MSRRGKLKLKMIFRKHLMIIFSKLILEDILVPMLWLLFLISQSSR